MAAEKAPTRATTAAVDIRDNFCCVLCGRAIDGGSRHHRQLRRHGDHSPANIVLLCGSGTTGCHGWVHAHPAASYAQGWLVHSWHAPELVPLPTAGRHGPVWAFHTRSGLRTTMTTTCALHALDELGLG